MAPGGRPSSRGPTPRPRQAASRRPGRGHGLLRAAATARPGPGRGAARAARGGLIARRRPPAAPGIPGAAGPDSPLPGRREPSPCLATTRPEPDREQELALIEFKSESPRAVHGERVVEEQDVELVVVE